MLKRLWKALKIGLLGVAAILLLVVAVVGFWVHRQLQPQDVTAARARWPKAMTFETADRAALPIASPNLRCSSRSHVAGAGRGDGEGGRAAADHPARAVGEGERRDPESLVCTGVDRGCRPAKECR